MGDAQQTVAAATKQARRSAFCPWTRRAGSTPAASTAPAAATAPAAGARVPAPAIAQAPCAAGARAGFVGKPESSPDAGASAAGAQALPGQVPGSKSAPGSVAVQAPGVTAQAQAGWGGQEGGLGLGSEPAGASLETYVDRTHYCYLFREEGVRRAQGW